MSLHALLFFSVNLVLLFLFHLWRGFRLYVQTRTCIIDWTSLLLLLLLLLLLQWGNGGQVVSCLESTSEWSGSHATRGSFQFFSTWWHSEVRWKWERDADTDQSLKKKVSFFTILVSSTSYSIFLCFFPLRFFFLFCYFSCCFFPPPILLSLFSKICKISTREGWRGFSKRLASSPWNRFGHNCCFVISAHRLSCTLFTMTCRMGCTDCRHKMSASSTGTATSAALLDADSTLACLQMLQYLTLNTALDSNWPRGVCLTGATARPLFIQHRA